MIRGKQFYLSITLLSITIILFIFVLSGCNQAGQMQLAEQIGQLNAKLDALSEENQKLKEEIAQQDKTTEEEDIEEAAPEEKIFYIDFYPDGSKDAATLAEAIDIIEPKGTIFLNEGNYYPDTNLKIIKPLTLLGAGRDVTKIMYDNQPNIVEYEGQGLLTISAIEFSRDGSNWGDVIWIKSGKINISDCFLSGATHFEKKEEGQVGGGMGILIWGETQGIIENCTIEDNSVDGIEIQNQSFINLIGNKIGNNAQYGISYWQESGGIVLNNQCYNNDSGIGIRSESVPKILANTCNNNSYAGIDYYGETGGIAFQNICYENGRHGISVGFKSGPKLIENVCRDNSEIGIVFYENSGGFAGFNEIYRNEYGIYIEKDANPDIGKNNFMDNTNDIKDER